MENKFTLEEKVRNFSIDYQEQKQNTRRCEAKRSIFLELIEKPTCNDTDVTSVLIFLKTLTISGRDQKLKNY